jgi:hypothetical protein
VTNLYLIAGKPEHWGPQIANPWIEYVPSIARPLTRQTTSPAGSTWRAQETPLGSHRVVINAWAEWAAVVLRIVCEVMRLTAIRAIGAICLALRHQPSVWDPLNLALCLAHFSFFLALVASANLSTKRSGVAWCSGLGCVFRGGSFCSDGSAIVVSMFIFS